MYYKFSDNDSCKDCVFLEKATRDNPNYCKREDDIERAVAACVECTKKSCPHYCSLADLKYIQDKYGPF